METFLRPGGISSRVLIVVFLYSLTKVCAFAESVKLLWNPSPGEDIVRHDLHYGVKSRDYKNRISHASAAGTTVSGLVPGVTYYFAVTAHNRDGRTSLFSNEESYTVSVDGYLPTLNPIGNVHLPMNSAAHTISLTGISPGEFNLSSGKTGKTRPVKITAVSSNRRLLKHSVRYSGGSAGTLTFKPALEAIGTTTFTISVNNGKKSNNLVKKTFTVTVLPPGQTIPATLQPATSVNDQFAFTVTGAVGLNYIVEASSDMMGWIPVHTNTAPFGFTDPESGDFSQRFYRSVSTP
jgi:hypothetical protein